MNQLLWQINLEGRCRLRFNITQLQKNTGISFIFIYLYLFVIL